MRFGGIYTAGWCDYFSPQRKRVNSRSGLELVAQAELHDARLRDLVVVSPPGDWVAEAPRSAERIKLRRVRYVENFPAKLQVVILVIGHVPLFRQSCIDGEITVASNVVTLSGETRPRIAIYSVGSRRIGEQVGSAW